MFLKKIFSNENQRWFFLAQISRLVTGFCVLSILTRNLRSESLATWYIFTSTFGFATMLEMGLGQIMSRHMAYLMADLKAARISAQGVLQYTRGCEIRYVTIAVGVGVIAGLSATLTIDFSNPAVGGTEHLLLAWIVYCAGGIATILSGFYGAMLSGTSRMWLVQKLVIGGSFVSLAVTSMIFVVGPSLLVPASALLLSQFVNLMQFRRRLFLYLEENARFSEIDKPLATPRYHEIYKDAAKSVIGMLSYQVLTSGFLLLLSKHLPKAFIASYGLTVQFTTIIIALSSTWIQGSFYEIAETKQSLNIEKMLDLFRGARLRSMTCCLIGLAAVMIGGPLFLHIIGSKTMLPLSPLLSLICVMVGCEFACGLYSQLLVARGELAVAYVALISSILVWCSVYGVLRAGLDVKFVFLARIAVMGVFSAIPHYYLYKRHVLQYS